MAVENFNINIEHEFNQFLQNKTFPDWILKLKTSSFECLKKLPFVSKSMESLAKIPLSNFDLQKILEPYSIAKPTVQNGSFQSFVELSLLDGENKQTVQNLLDSILKKNEFNFFVLLNLCFFKNAYYLKICEAHQKQNIKISYTFPESNTGFMPLTIFQIDKFISCSITEEIIADTNKEISFINPFTYIQLDDSSNIKYYSLEKFNSSAFHIRKIQTEQKKDSSLQLGYFNLGGYRGKTFIENNMMGEGSFFELIGTSLPIKREFQDVECQVNHLASKTTSSLKFKSVLKDKSHHVFTGNLFIPKESKQVKAAQVNNNLVLHKTARAESMPKLEVFAEDVSCSHGATMGEVEKDQLFYLCSRGLTENEARYLIVQGFLNEIIDKIDSEGLSGEIWNFLLNKLNT